MGASWDITVQSTEYGIMIYHGLKRLGFLFFGPYLGGVECWGDVFPLIYRGMNIDLQAMLQSTRE